MKIFSYILLIILACLIIGCNSEKEDVAEGISPEKDTVAIFVRNEDEIYDLVENPLTPEAKAKAKAEEEALLKKLVIKDIKEGTGRAAEEGNVVEVHYTGKLDDGTVFDSSLTKEPPAPFEFRLGKGFMVKGWDLGLVGMKEGGKRHLDIPAGLGYGDQRMGKIPANSDLHFDIELIAVKDYVPPVEN
ncbi:MAG: FKBP-type peptidyl-prolyl cis-trans isomerase [Abditibacteriota bacterium]|nr:FKBP-type peptidyl-prolyl cis-trans isomerase [Abditibacteriota bacterium]